jgi:protein-S-isoprenylcysteine O-methyltransferase Ste14
VVFFLLLMVMGWGDVRGFFASPARVVMVALLVGATPVMTICTGGRSRGVEHAHDVPWFFPALVVHSLFTAFVMPWMDARAIWTLPGGEALRWVGVTLFALGVMWRLGPMVTLGRRFSSVVALQQEHQLHTGGFFAALRHPSYLGIVLMDLGFAGIYRSVLALALMPLVFLMFHRRMDVEEALLLRRFGGEYRAYMGRTARLIPGLY